MSESLLAIIGALGAFGYLLGLLVFYFLRLMKDNRKNSFDHVVIIFWPLAGLVIGCLEILDKFSGHAFGNN